MSPCWLISFYSLTVHSLDYTADSDILSTCPCQQMLWKTPLRSTCKQWGGKSACNCGQYWYRHLLMFPTEFHSLQSRKCQVLVSWTEEAGIQVTWELLLDSFFLGLMNAISLHVLTKYLPNFSLGTVSSELFRSTEHV